MVSFRPGGGGADRCSGAWKGCCAGYWKRGEAWCQGDLWKCRRRPADSAAIVPCFEASLRGYTEALCCSGLPSLSRFLLRASPSAPLQGSLGVGLSDQPGVLPLLLFLSSLRLILLSLRFSLSFLALCLLFRTESRRAGLKLSEHIWLLIHPRNCLDCRWFISSLNQMHQKHRWCDCYTELCHVVCLRNKTLHHD